jgi:two-component system, OmpR family, KDP operon response regulator KdpE
MKVLIGDPDTQLVAVLSDVLQQNGYEVVTASDGLQALAVWRAEQPDLVLLEDRDLSGMRGWEVARAIQRYGRTPVILLSARPTETAIIRGLESGVDHYLTKPVSLRQLLAYMQAVLRRAEPTAEPAPSVLRVGEWLLDLPARIVTTAAGQKVQLTPLEWRLLQGLIANLGQVVPYAQLIWMGWGYSDEHTSELLKSHTSSSSAVRLESVLIQVFLSQVFQSSRAGGAVRPSRPRRLTSPQPRQSGVWAAATMRSR